MSKNKICFCTLAVGVEYRLASLFLYQTIEFYNKGMELVVLTDDTSFYKHYPNITAIHFATDSMFGCYHDKRFVIAQALLRYESCCYLDSDCRLLAALPDSYHDLQGSAIYAWNVMDFLPRFEREKRYESERGIKRFNSCDRRYKLVSALADELDVDLRQTKFMSEVCMFYSRSNESYKSFLLNWHKAARALQKKGYSWGEGETIGILAKKESWDVIGIDCSSWLFKDNLPHSDGELVARYKSDRVIISALKKRKSTVLKIIRLLGEACRHLADANRKYIYKLIP